MKCEKLEKKLYWKSMNQHEIYESFDQLKSRYKKLKLTSQETINHLRLEMENLTRKYEKILVDHDDLKSRHEYYCGAHTEQLTSEAKMRNQLK